MIYEPLFLLFLVASFLLRLDPSPRKRPNGITVRPTDLVDLLCGNSERELQAQLNSTAPARPDHRIGGGYVWRRASATEGAKGRRIVLSVTILSAVRISEVGMVENVEELGAELGMDTFTKMPVLGNREIEVLESGVGEQISRHVAQLPQRRRQHDGSALGVAPIQVQCRGCGSGPSVHGQRLCGTGGWRIGVARA